MKTKGKDLILSSQEPTRSGYKFRGWATSANSSSVSYQPGSTYSGNSNLTLYAVWELSPSYTVSYNANGGSGAPPAQTKQYNKTLTLSSTKPIRDGYTFKGWALSSVASNVQYQPGSSYTSNKNLTLYAVWERNKVESSLTFSTNAITLDAGSSKTIDIKFKGDGIKYLGFSPENKENSICYLSWADIDWRNGTTSVTVTGKEPGTVTITVHFLDANENSFFSQKSTPNRKSLEKQGKRQGMNKEFTTHLLRTNGNP